MTRRLRAGWPVRLGVIAVLAGTLPPAPSRAADTPCSRVVSLAPSITEVLFALDLGPRVVGAAQSSDFPPEAKAIPRVGGFLDANPEAILALDPSDVVLLKEESENRDGLLDLGMKAWTVDHSTVNGILESIEAVGSRCKRKEKAAQVLKGIHDRIERMRARTSGRSRKRVLLTLAYPEAGSIPAEGIFAIGRSVFLHELLVLAGADNAYEGPDLPYPVLSREGLLAIDPDMIIDLAPRSGRNGPAHGTSLTGWKKLEMIPAVRNGQVRVLTDDHLLIPGPRFVLTLEALARAIHSEKEGGGNRSLSENPYPHPLPFRERESPLLEEERVRVRRSSQGLTGIGRGAKP